jgi:hypothetical protein
MTDKVVVGWKSLTDNMIERDVEYGYQFNALSTFEIKHKAAINYLVKEFEMRKKAAELRRVSIADTGMIDTNLLHSYKYDDNLFLKIANVADGKNHGLFMMLDWSGSMTENMKGTLEQVMILTTFCRKVNIPFEVYCFSTAWKDNRYITVPGKAKRYENCIDKTKTPENSLFLEPNFSLLQLMTSRMPNSNFRRAANDLINISNAWGGYGYRNATALLIKPGLELGGTPLNDTIVVMSKLVNDFKAVNKLEVVNTVILTDGEDSSFKIIQNKTYNGYEKIGAETRWGVSYLFDPDTKKSYKIKRTITTTLLEILKDRTGCNLIGFYVIKNSKNYFESAYRKVVDNVTTREAAFIEFKENKVYGVTGQGYDEYYIIAGGRALEVEDSDLDDILGTGAQTATVRKLKGAFLKLNQNRLTSRVLLKKFIDRIT